MTTTPVTAATIVEAARQYNADYAGPELDAAFAAASPVLYVTAEPVGWGREVRVTVTPGLYDGEASAFYGAADPVMLVVPRQGRVSTEDVARRVVRTRFAGVDVPIRVRTFV